VAVRDAESVIDPLGLEPELLIDHARRLRELSTNHDIVLSIDRLLPAPLSIPCVLMSNTIAYLTEASAVQGNQWRCVVAPTMRHADLVRGINPAVRVTVVGYGIQNLETVSPCRTIGNCDEPVIVRLPHRPDRRKGHTEAIEGLAMALPASRNIMLDISWLDEPRYAHYREELLALATRVGVESNIVFSCWKDGVDHRRASARSSATLQLGCFEESFGLSIVESILIGHPAVIRPQPAVREVVGESDLLLEVSDPLQWHQALSSYWSGKSGYEPDKRDALRRLFSFDRMVTGYHELLRNVAGV
jgi:glycosyltransferase involved in cell wall biosynthesis